MLASGESGSVKSGVIMDKMERMPPNPPVKSPVNAPGEPNANELAGDTPTRTLKRLFLATRPQFLTTSILPVAVGTAWGFRTAGELDGKALVLALTATVLVHAGANILNDVFDDTYGGDRDNTDRIYPFTGGSRFIQNAILTRNALQSLALVLLAAAVGFGLLLTALKGPVVLALGGIGAGLGYMYSAPPVRLCSRGLGEAAVGIAFGLLPVTGAAWLQSGRMDAATVTAAFSVSLWIAAVLIVNEIPDDASDAAAGRRTLVVRMGRTGARRLYLGIQVAAFAILTVAVVAEVYPWPALGLPVLLLIGTVKAYRFIREGRVGMEKCIRMTLAIHATGCLWLAGLAIFFS